jgi:hypothetical protein
LKTNKKGGSVDINEFCRINKLNLTINLDFKREFRQAHFFVKFLADGTANGETYQIEQEKFVSKPFKNNFGNLDELREYIYYLEKNWDRENGHTIQL